MCSSSGGQKLYYTASGIITPTGGRPVSPIGCGVCEGDLEIGAVRTGLGLIGLSSHNK